MASRYLDVDEILAEEERVPCEFLFRAARLGHLDVTTGSEDIEEDQVVTLPLWLAERLSDNNVAFVKLPHAFSRRVRDAMLAAPETAPLRERSPYFYEVGMRLTRAMREEDPDAEEAATLPKTMKSTLARRVHMIINASQHSGSADATPFLSKLTDLEQQLYWEGFKHEEERKRWKLGQKVRIEATAMAGGGRGRGAGATVGVGKGGGRVGVGAGGGGSTATPGLRSVTGVGYKRQRVAM